MITAYDIKWKCALEKKVYVRVRVNEHLNNIGKSFEMSKVAK